MFNILILPKAYIVCSAVKCLYGTIPRSIHTTCFCLKQSFCYLFYDQIFIYLLSIFIFIHLFIYLFIYLFISLFIYLFIFSIIKVFLNQSSHFCSMHILCLLMRIASMRHFLRVYITILLKKSFCHIIFDTKSEYPVKNK